MIEEVTQDFKSLNSSLKKGLGKNGYTLLIAGGLVVALVLIIKSKQQAQEDEYTVATGVASYPDAGENADVIISSIGSSIDYAQDEIIDSIGGTVKDTGEDIKDTMTGQHEEIKDLISNNNNTSSGGDYSWGNSTIIDTVENSTEVTHGTGLNHFGRGNTTAPDVNNMYEDITIDNGYIFLPTQQTAKATGNSTGSSSLANNTMQSVKKKAVNKSATKSTASTSKSVSIKKPNYSGNSIVDGLKKAGVNSSYSARKELAKANGIKNYTGTASQNTKLLNSLKSGTLKPASSSSSKSSSSKSSSSKSSSSKSSSSKSSSSKSSSSKSSSNKSSSSKSSSSKSSSSSSKKKK